MMKTALAGLTPPAKIFRVLLVESHDRDARRVRSCLRAARGAVRFSLQRVSSRQMASRRLKTSTFDVILLAQDLPDSEQHAINLLNHSTNTPILILSRGPEDQIGLSAVRSGAQDFFAKSRLDGPQLQRAIEYAIERHRVAAKLEHMAHTDALTGVGNRGLFDSSLASTDPHRIAVVRLDLDHFKDTNDRYGHAVGDALLRGVADRLQKRLRHGDIICRLGGDEFGVILVDIESPADAMLIGNDLLKRLQEPYDVHGICIHQTVSIGVALHQTNQGNAAALVRAADASMYAAKTSGGGRVALHTQEMEQALLSRLEVGGLLKGILERDELTVHFQPILDVQTGGWVGVETLARWYSPDLNRWIRPDEFIPLAETSGQIVELGTWILDRSLAFLASVRGGCPHLQIAVNVSARQLDTEGFPDLVLKTLDAYGLPPDVLCIEVTETALLSGRHGGFEALHAMKDAGVTISLDDFGTGFSSLTHLREFPVDVLKIDRSFISGSGVDGGASKLVRALIALGSTLDLCVVAEGVETHEQLHFLREADCHHAQGFLMSHPVPAEEARALLFAQQKVAG